MINLIKKLLGDKAQRDQKALQPLVDKTKEEFVKLAALSNDQLRAKTLEFKKRIQDFIQADEDQVKALKEKTEGEAIGLEEKEAIYDQIDKINKGIDEKVEEVLGEILPEAFAVVKETARRFSEGLVLEVEATEMDKNLAQERNSIEIKGDRALWHKKWMAGGTEVSWDMVHYDVQLFGGAVLHQGKIAEMQTGEGKTLVATLPVYLNALSGKGVHLVTVNDYLAKRDSEWMGPLYEFHGLSVDCIDKHQPNSPERRAAYLADITFGTNNEFGFDYLRDNMASDPEDLVQRKHNYAIVDEVDSVLIDDARTPLIISGPIPGGEKNEFIALRPKVEKLYNAQKKLATTLLAEAKKNLEGIDSGNIDKEIVKEGGVSLLKVHRALPKSKALIKFLSEPGVKTHLQKTENTYLQDQGKEMQKIDKDLYFVIEEKNHSIELTDKGIDLISSGDEGEEYILPDVGTVIAEIENSSLSEPDKIKKKETLIQDYSAKAERIHSMNQLLKAYAMFEKDTEYVVMENKVKIVDEQTGRIMEGRRYSDGLHQAIEAKEDVKVEAATQTYATVTLQNYFRMYHKLSGMTGTAETEAKELWDIYELDVVVIPTNRPIQRKDQEDLVFKTNREKYTAIAEEIVKLRDAGRPILVGTTSVEISELLSKMLHMRKVDHNVLNAKLHKKEAEIVAEAGKKGVVTIATNMAGRGTDIKLSQEVKDAGGLAIIGTERHDSRRVDRQLRGRSGRQGDPGSSQFFVSLEDNLMRIFGSDRIAGLMDRMGLEEGEVIQHKWISKSIERAQRKVEENNFGIRKRLLEYDDVMNAQREVIYKKRHHALFGDRLEVDIANAFYDTCENLVIEGKDFGNYEEFKLDVIKNLSIECPFSEEDLKEKSLEDLSVELYDALSGSAARRFGEVAKKALPIIKNVYETQGDQWKFITVPFTDRTRTMRLPVNLEEAYKSEGKNLQLALEKAVSLAVIDNEWKEHLREMDDLKQSVQMAVHEQKDPLLIYKFESFELFKQMILKVNKEVVSFLVKADLAIAQESGGKIEQRRAPEPKKKENYQTSRPGSSEEGEKKKVAPVRAERKVGRNDPCPCGSGKKYKHCHGKDQH